MSMDTIAGRLHFPTDKKTLGGLMVLAAEAGFGTLAVFGKLANTIGLSTSTMLLFRFIIATIAVWVIFGVHGQARFLSGRPLWIALALGVIYGIMNGLFFEGLDYLSAGLAAIIFYTYPVYVFVVATAVLNERLTYLKILALSIAVVGVVLIAGANPTEAKPIGFVLLLLSAIAYATYMTGIRAALSSVDSETLTATALIATTLSMVPFGMMSGGLSIPIGADQWLLVFGIGFIGTAVPVILLFQGLNWVEASHASIIGTSEPMMTVLLGVVLLNETVTPITVAGGGFILFGVVLIQRDSRKTEPGTQ